MESEKEAILTEALSTIVTEFIEMELINKDHTGYVKLLRQSICDRSLTTFRDGVEQFYNAIKVATNQNDINSLHMRFMMRCINSEVVMLSAAELYRNVKENLLSTPLNITYDLARSDTDNELNKIEQILLLLHIYNDRIIIAILGAAKPEPSKRGWAK